MAIYQLQDLRSCLKYFDDHYLSDKNTNLVSQLDINVLSEQKKIIEILIEPEFQDMDQTNKQNFYKILAIALNSEETKLNSVFDSMSAVVRCHESEHHLAMLIAYGEQYWLKGISSDEPDDYFEWEEKYRKEHNLALESFEIINKTERFKNENN